jgi:uncharacterized membrane protein
VVESSAGEAHTLEARDRWLAAVCYLGPGWLAPILMRGSGEFLRWHVRQGFALFFAEAIGVALLIILESTLGRIPVLGVLVILILQLALFVACLILSVLGFVKALAGEHFRIPILDEYAERVPIDLA